MVRGDDDGKELVVRGDGVLEAGIRGDDGVVAVGGRDGFD